MQHPVAYRILPNGTFEVSSFWGLMFNPWAWLQYAHNECGSVVTASFVMAAVGAFYLLQGREVEFGRMFVKLGVIAGAISCAMMIFPLGDLHAKFVAHHQPAAIAGMEGLFNTEKGATLVLMGQPDVEAQKIDNPLPVNDVLSFLIYGTTKAEVEGLNSSPRDQWPTALPLLYYSYHIMAGLGTYFAGLMLLAALWLWRGKLFTARWLLWPLLLSFPLPYIANTAGSDDWPRLDLQAVGGQGWRALIRTAEGYPLRASVDARRHTVSVMRLLSWFSWATRLLWILWIRKTASSAGGQLRLRRGSAVVATAAQQVADRLSSGLLGVLARWPLR